VKQMQLLMIEGDSVVLVYNPLREQVEVGENIMIIDRGDRRGILVQIVEISVPDLPGILLNIIRKEASEVEVIKHASREASERYHAVENMKYTRARVTRQLIADKDGNITFSMWTGYVPSRNADFRRIDELELIEALRGHVHVRV